MNGAMTPREGAATARPTWVNGWAQHGACSRTDPNALFVQGSPQQTAKQICLRCPVIVECLADSLDNRIEFGIWGGMTERHRRALLKGWPEVVSWRALLQVECACTATPPETTAATDFRSQ